MFPWSQPVVSEGAGHWCWDRELGDDPAFEPLGGGAFSCGLHGCWASTGGGVGISPISPPPVLLPRPLIGSTGAGRSVSGGLEGWGKVGWPGSYSIAVVLPRHRHFPGRAGDNLPRLLNPASHPEWSGGLAFLFMTGKNIVKILQKYNLSENPKTIVAHPLAGSTPLTGSPTVLLSVNGARGGGGE